MTNEHQKKRYLITGGTGFLGWHILKLLLSKGSYVKILARKKSKELVNLIHKLQSENAGVSPVEFVEASILDKSALMNSVHNIDGIFHLAGSVVHSRICTESVFETNVTGTLNVMEAAASRPGIKVVFASTSGTVSCSTDPTYVANDFSPYCNELISSWPYYKSKMDAEIFALRYADTHNVDLVILRPTMIFGPEDYYNRATKLIKSYLEGKIPFIPSGGLSFLDVRDAAVAFVNAMGFRGKSGDKFLLTSTNCSIDEFFTKLETVSGIKKSRLHLNSTLTIVASRLLDFYYRRVLGRWNSDVDPVKAEMANCWWNTDSSRASKILNVSFMDHMQTLQDTVQWIMVNEFNIL